MLNDQRAPLLQAAQPPVASTSKLPPSHSLLQNHRHRHRHRPRPRRTRRTRATLGPSSSPRTACFCFILAVVLSLFSSPTTVSAFSPSHHQHQHHHQFIKHRSTTEQGGKELVRRLEMQIQHARASEYSAPAGPAAVEINKRAGTTKSSDPTTTTTTTVATKRRTTTTLPSTTTTTGVASVSAFQLGATISSSTTSNLVSTVDVGSLGADASGTLHATGSLTSSATAATSVPSGYSIPRAFDSTLGTAFSSTACPSFFLTFLADETFIACAPFSLLLSTSSAFFTAEKSPLTLLPYVLAATCAPSIDVCRAKMSQLATQIRLQNTCGTDLAQGNALAVEALAGFQNYELMRAAGCMRNNATGQYCFAEAAAQSTASELYYYYLPTGTSLPSGTKTTCGSCTQDLMSLYAIYATNSSLSISKTYSAARTLSNQNCGPTFASVVVAAVSAGSRLGAGSSSSSSWGLVGAVVMMALGWVV
ncbi:hypothetical protein T439DRAFT_109782 [Meredithblackwellia eburnea MCA 4105]